MINSIIMLSARIAAVIGLVLLTLPVASVFAGTGYPPSVPILGTTGGAAALASPTLYSGVLTVLYADGSPVLLSINKATFKVCSTSCVTVSASLKQTSPGTYTYTFTPPSLTGTITIYIQHESLADDNGRVFPVVDTQIGTYASSSSSPASLPSTSTPLAGSPVSPESNQVTRQAVTTTPVNNEAPLLQVALALTVLSIVAVGLLILPTRRKQN